VTGCRSHSDLVGPYVLNALEPDELDEMRLHLERCPRCASEVRSLADLPGLLDRAEADDATATPSPELEEEVLDRFVKERAKAFPQKRSRRRLLIPAAAAAAVLLAALVIAVIPGGTDRAYARADLWSLPAGGGAEGTADVAEVAAGTRVQLHAKHLPVAKGTAYELWCVRKDGRWVSGGSFHARADGSAAADLTAAVRPGEYRVVVITRRSTGADRGAEVMRGKLAY
jgi:hypothetical protein